jgi:hypothetical protein
LQLLTESPEKQSFKFFFRILVKVIVLIGKDNPLMTSIRGNQVMFGLWGTQPPDPRVIKVGFSLEGSQTREDAITALKRQVNEFPWDEGPHPKEFIEGYRISNGGLGHTIEVQLNDPAQKTYVSRFFTRNLKRVVM